MKVILSCKGEEHYALFNNAISMESKIPKGMLDAVMVTYDNDETVKIPRQYITEDFDRESFLDHISRLDERAIDTVQIVVNLDTAYSQVKAYSKQVMNSVFNTKQNS